MKVIEVIERAVIRADIKYREATTIYNMTGSNKDDVHRTAGAYYALSDLLSEIKSVKEKSNVKDLIEIMISNLQESIAAYEQKLEELSSLPISSGMEDIYRNNINGMSMTIQYLCILEKEILKET